MNHFFSKWLSGLCFIICLMSEMLRNPVGRHLRHGTGIHVAAIQQNNLRDVVIETAAFRLSSWCVYIPVMFPRSSIYKPLIWDSSSLLLLLLLRLLWQRSILMCYSPLIECIKIILVQAKQLKRPYKVIFGGYNNTCPLLILLFVQN